MNTPPTPSAAPLAAQPSRPGPRLQEPHSGPWWRYRIMWLVVGGPALVVIAGFFTLYLAIANPDYLYTDEQRHAATGGMAPEKTGGSESGQPAPR